MRCNQSEDMMGDPLPEDGKGVVVIFEGTSDIANCYLSSDLLQFFNARDVMMVEWQNRDRQIHKLPHGPWITDLSAKMLICSTLKFFRVVSSVRTEIGSTLGASRFHGGVYEDVRTLAPCDENGELIDTIPEIDEKCASEFKIDDSEHLRNLYMALIESISEGNEQVVRAILQNPRIDVGAFDNRAIRVACNEGSPEIVKMLLQDPRADPSAKDNYCIKHASENGETEIVKLLLRDSRVDPAGDTNRPFVSAIQNNRYDTVKAFLESKKIDPGFPLNFPLVSSLELPDDRIFKMLLQDSRINPAINDQEVVKEAVRLDNKKAVKILLDDYRVDPNVALITACQLHRKKIIMNILGSLPSIRGRILKNTVENAIQILSNYTNIEVREALLKFYNEEFNIPEQTRKKSRK
jgi:hypothetical protein